jgi:hypothetical protein
MSEKRKESGRFDTFVNPSVELCSALKPLVTLVLSERQISGERTPAISRGAA